MNVNQSPAVFAARPFLTTEELATLMCVRPTKLPNRFLAWPNNAVQQLMGEVAA